MATRSRTTHAQRRGSSTRALKDPKGGLTAAGRARYRKTEGAQLKPGVKGKADTPEKLRRKGSFLRRHFAHPRGPMLDAKGEPTRLALSAHAWGEPVPRTLAAARKLAQKGSALLERYQREKAKAGGSKGRKTPAAAAKRKTAPRRKAAPRRAR